MNLLDLDDVLTWEETYKDFLGNDVSYVDIEKAISQDTDDGINNILGELQVRAECVQSPEILLLRQRCKHHFKKVFTHVAAYHACRPSDIASYLRSGLVPADTEKLIAEAKILFEDPDAVNRAIEDIGETYLDHGRGKIGFFISRTGALESGYSHYLRYGSELFKAIARRLGDLAEKKITSRGTPILFRCALPVAWLDDFTTFPMMESYALKPLFQLLVRIRKPEHSDDAIIGAFLLTRSVPCEYILEYIDMTSFMKEEHEV
jgi:hypothetical protein